MKTKKILFYLLAGLLGGCVPVMSLHPLYNEADVVFEKHLVGTWLEDVTPFTTWEFKCPNEPEKLYKLILSEDEGSEGSFDVYLVKLENRLFLDVYPNSFPGGDVGDVDDPNAAGELLYNAFFFVPVHTFIKIDSIAPQLKMRLTDDDEMQTLLKEDPNAVRHELVDDKLVLTAPTKELQAFVRKYADDSRVFPDEKVLIRKETTDTEATPKRDPNDSGTKQDKKASGKKA